MKRYVNNEERHLIQALINIRVRCRNDYNILLRWLKESRQEQQDTNDELSGDEVANGQGYSLCLRDLIKEMESAPDSMTKLRTDG
jgi:hypothetical protein